MFLCDTTIYNIAWTFSFLRNLILYSKHDSNLLNFPSFLSFPSLQSFPCPPYLFPLSHYIPLVHFISSLDSFKKYFFWGGGWLFIIESKCNGCNNKKYLSGIVLGCIPILPHNKTTWWSNNFIFNKLGIF